jgi:hypothetical protein
MAAGAASSILILHTLHSPCPRLAHRAAADACSPQLLLPRTGGRGVAQRAAGAREAAGRAPRRRHVALGCSGTTEPRALLSIGRRRGVERCGVARTARRAARSGDTLRRVAQHGGIRELQFARGVPTWTPRVGEVWVK